VVRLGYDTHLRWSTAVIVGALLTPSIMAAPGVARAESFMDFLFGGGQQRQVLSAKINSYAEPSAPLASATPIAPHHPKRVAATSVAFCVRVCDGRYFPLDHANTATPVETCRAMCSAGKTKLFFGSGIDHAVTSDGGRYVDLQNAYVYRDHLVPNCTCNGKDAFGLASIDPKEDSTLRPGDIVSTKDGLMAYSGGRGTTHVFTPVDASAVALHPGSARMRLGRLSARF
jgi:hypothetical protein